MLLSKEWDVNSSLGCQELQISCRKMINDFFFCILFFVLELWEQMNLTSAIPVGILNSPISSQHHICIHICKTGNRAVYKVGLTNLGWEVAAPGRNQNEPAIYSEGQDKNCILVAQSSLCICLYCATICFFSGLLLQQQEWQLPLGRVGGKWKVAQVNPPDSVLWNKGATDCLWDETARERSNSKLGVEWKT